eukprot:scaffold6912_cov17-Prasinocladus_malaysianus.AAC.1
MPRKRKNDAGSSNVDDKGEAPMETENESQTPHDNTEPAAFCAINVQQQEIQVLHNIAGNTRTDIEKR